MKKTILKPLFFVAAGAILLTACGEEAKTENKVEEETFDERNSFRAVFDDQIFSIPSPIQTGYLIKKLNLKFDESLLSDRAAVANYASEHKQALNMGVYGTDLGYASMYGQKNTSLNYLKTIETLSNSLGLDAAFSAKFIAEFENNSGDEDKMVKLMSQAFKNADNFLKNANRKAVSAKILAGGWIESMHYATTLNSRTQSEEIQRRIAQQKQSLESIIELLTQYNDDKTNDELLAQLKDLKDSFDMIVLEYVYDAPSIEADKNKMKLNHTYNIEFDQATADEIASKIAAIRNGIIKA
ncbi:MAG: hypothetical protein NXI10_15275 [bacterium]|nr:hypothetical protein [bacterium]